MSFLAVCEVYRDSDFTSFFKNSSEKNIRTILQKQSLSTEDYLALLSPAAQDFLEPMAQKAHQLTLQHFGRTVLAYTPLYLSNFCSNRCRYCSFNAVNQLERKQLSPAEVRAEAEEIAKQGFHHILILTGDAPGIATVEYVKQCVTILREYFSSIAIEIYALTESEYRELARAGVDGLTIYQETYDPKVYDQMHISGPKKDYAFRLDAPERGCKAGIRAVNIGALLGLADWRKDAFLTGLHAQYLQNKYLEAEISISMPRIRPNIGGFQPTSIMSDRDMVQFMLAFRLFMPRAGITVSTRESAEFRDNVLPLGVTKMSAGSKTCVGGHLENATVGQFKISDERDAKQMQQMLAKQGYQYIFKDWLSLVQ